MLEAVVLAGGSSTRMGFAKALLRAPDGRPFVIRIIETLREAGLPRVTVVTGAHHELIADACAAHPGIDGAWRCVRNPDPSRGQLSSLLVAMDAVVGPGTEGLLVTLVDVPMVAVETVRRLADVWRANRAPIVRPAIGAAHGHPVIFDRDVFEALRSAPPELGAKSVIRARAGRVQDVPVDDEGCLVDIDTREEYARLRPGP
jgi:CTP:molybdopterin cytidylyltransferase MocA